MSISIVLQYNMYIIVNEAVQHFLVCFYSNTAKGEFRGAHNESWKVAAFWGQILKMFIFDTTIGGSDFGNCLTLSMLCQIIVGHKFQNFTF